ncbi:MAG: hypothetical protein ACE5JX_21665 [Acidobacteriota bacterium]
MRKFILSTAFIFLLSWVPTCLAYTLSSSRPATAGPAATETLVPPVPPTPSRELVELLTRVQRLYSQLQQPTQTSFKSDYVRMYGILSDMQEVSNQADIAFIRGFSPTLAGSLIDQIVKVHILVAIGAARAGATEAFERNVDLILERLRKQYGYQGQTAQARLLSILKTGQTLGPAPRLLSEELCQWAVADFCNSTQPSPFQSYRAASGDAVELVFDRSNNLYNLEEFEFTVVRPLSKYSELFANHLNQRLQDPLVNNWFIRDYLNQPVPAPNLPAPQPGLPQIVGRQSRISIEPQDYLQMDPADLQKQQWLNTIRAMFRQEQRISLSSGIPDGEYYVHRRDQAVPAGAEANLVVDRSRGLHPLGFELIMEASGSGVEVIPFAPIGQEEPLWGKLLKPDFQLLRFDLGADDNTNFEGGGEFRLFHRFSQNFAWQTQFEGAFRSHRDRVDLGGLSRFVDRERRELGEFDSREFQLDFGPVFRAGDVQFAAMQSLRWVNRDGWDKTGTIGQFFFNVGYLFSHGQVGGFFTLSNKDESVVRRVVIDQVFTEETFLKVVDQVGVNFNLQVTDSSSVEGAFGVLDTALRDNVPGGVVRYNLPPWKRFLLTAEFGYNESFVAPENSWRFGVGLRIGNWGKQNSPATFHSDKEPVPVFVPRVRYETLTRIVREGNRAPIADAGPDQLDQVPQRQPDGNLQFVCQLDGTNSHDPDGDSIKFVRRDDAPGWQLQTDCRNEIQLAGADTATPSLVLGGR